MSAYQLYLEMQKRATEQDADYTAPIVGGLGLGGLALARYNRGQPEVQKSALDFASLAQKARGFAQKVPGVNKFVKPDLTLEARQSLEGAITQGLADNALPTKSLGLKRDFSKQAALDLT